MVSLPTSRSILCILSRSVVHVLPMVKQTGVDMTLAAKLGGATPNAYKFFNYLTLELQAEISLIPHSKVLFPSIIIL
jgi:hypothetical protein